ncbi:Uncharacterised protein [Bordetella pertussis]|nr:Uncharacterised protein [Bordetella pertussis]
MPIDTPAPACAGLLRAAEILLYRWLPNQRRAARAPVRIRACHKAKWEIRYVVDRGGTVR